MSAYSFTLDPTHAATLGEAIDFFYPGSGSRRKGEQPPEALVQFRQELQRAVEAGEDVYLDETTVRGAQVVLGELTRRARPLLAGKSEEVLEHLGSQWHLRNALAAADQRKGWQGGFEPKGASGFLHNVVDKIASRNLARLNRLANEQAAEGSYREAAETLLERCYVLLLLAERMEKSHRLSDAAGYYRQWQQGWETVVEIFAGHEMVWSEEAHEVRDQFVGSLLVWSERLHHLQELEEKIRGKKTTGQAEGKAEFADIRPRHFTFEPMKPLYLTNLERKFYGDFIHVKALTQQPFSLLPKIAARLVEASLFKEAAELLLQVVWLARRYAQDQVLQGNTEEGRRVLDSVVMPNLFDAAIAMKRMTTNEADGEKYEKRISHASKFIGKWEKQFTFWKDGAVSAALPEPEELAELLGWRHPTLEEVEAVMGDSINAADYAEILWTHDGTFLFGNIDWVVLQLKIGLEISQWLPHLLAKDKKISRSQFKELVLDSLLAVVSELEQVRLTFFKPESSWQDYDVWEKKDDSFSLNPEKSSTKGTSQAGLGAIVYQHMQRLGFRLENPAEEPLPFGTAYEFPREEGDPAVVTAHIAEGVLEISQIDGGDMTAQEIIENYNPDAAKLGPVPHDAANVRSVNLDLLSGTLTLALEGDRLIPLEEDVVEKPVGHEAEIQENQEGHSTSQPTRGTDGQPSGSQRSAPTALQSGKKPDSVGRRNDGSTQGGSEMASFRTPFMGIAPSHALIQSGLFVQNPTSHVVSLTGHLENSGIVQEPALQTEGALAVKRDWETGRLEEEETRGLEDWERGRAVSVIPAQAGIQMVPGDSPATTARRAGSLRGNDTRATIRAMKKFMRARGYGHIAKKMGRKLSRYAQNFEQMSRRQKMKVVRQLSRQYSRPSSVPSKAGQMMRFGAVATHARSVAMPMMMRVF